MTNQCAHGQLRRQCNVCERDEQIATLTSKLERMREIAYKMDACGLGSIDAPEWLDELLREVGES